MDSSSTTTTTTENAGAATPTLSSTSTSTPIEAAAAVLNAIVEGAKATMRSTSTTAEPTTSTQTTSAHDSPITTSSTSAPTVNVAELSASLQHFGIVDYCVFVLMLVVCAFIGFYFGFIEKKKKKNRNVEERRGSEALDYLVGGRKMKVFPVSLSLVASFVSGISLLGTSTEIYVYGTQYAFILITLAISGVISWYVFLPVFCNLQLTSTYEYFEMRYDKCIRLFGSVLFTLGTILWLPIVIYVPALAFNQVTGINIHIITPIVCLVCIFYTCVGGLKAVVWTDVIQTFVMVGAIILVIIKGTHDVGGVGVVLQRNWDSGRIEAPTATWDPTERASLFSVLLGTTFFYVQCTATNQVIMQRYLSVPSIREAKKCMILFTIGICLLFSCCFYNGLLLFARYYDCDPLSTKLAKAKDQLVPLLVMDILSVFPGMPGLFVAGVFSAALSSLSTGLNSLAAVLLEDYIKPFRKTPLTEHQTAIIMRATVVIIGVICVALVFVVERLGTVLQLSMALGSIASGPLLGLFFMGVLIPWINSKSAMSGSVLAFCVMSWVCLNGQAAIAMGELVYAEKPVSTEGCTYLFETAVPAFNKTVTQHGAKTLAQYIYHMSFMFYAAVGAFLTILFSGISSFIYGVNDPSKMNLDLFSPFVRRFIKSAEYKSVEIDEQKVIMDYKLKDPIKAR